MMRNENYKAGLAGNCTEQQILYSELYNKLDAVRAGKVRRNLLGVAVTSKPRNVKRPDERGKRIERDAITKDSLILDFNQIDFWFMWDRPVRGRRCDHRVETVVSGETGFVDKQGTVRIGGDPYRNHSMYRFDEQPFQPCQAESADTFGKNQELKAPRAGDLYVRRLGEEHLDLLIGHKGKKYVAYRLPYRAVESGQVTLSYQGPMPEPGETVHGVDIPVAEGDVIATIGDHDVYYTKAIFPDEGWPQMLFKTDHILCANKEFEFSLFNVMNYEMTELTRFFEDAEVKHPVNPNQWQIGIYFEFTTLQGLAHHSNFRVSTALQRDICDALGPRGLNRSSSSRTPGAGRREFLQIKADHTGEIVQVHETDGNGYIQIEYADGARQLVPSAAELQVQAGPVNEGDVLGDYCRRDMYSWEQVERIFGSTLPFVVESFLLDWAIKPGEFGWDGPNFLVDARYTQCVVAELGVKDSRDRIVCKADFRAAADYVDPTVGIVLPPMRYPNWDEPHLNLWGIEVFLGTSAERDKLYKANRRRQRRRQSRQKAKA